MVLDSAANFVRETTTESVDSTQTSIGVSDASAFVDPSAAGETDYNVVVWDADNNPRPDQDSSVEIMRVTAIDTGTDTLTVTRGVEGTSGASHPNGAAVAMMPTAGNMFDATVVSANYTTSGEDIIYVDESGGAVTVTLASSDTTQGNEIEIVNLTGTNTVTVDTEGAETINPGGESSKSLTKAGWTHTFVAKDGSTWETGDLLQSSVAFPDSAIASARSVIIGGGAEGSNTNDNVLVGEGASGKNAKDSAMVGQGISANNAAWGVALGQGITLNANGSIGIGRQVTVGTASVARLGGESDQLVFPGTQDTIADADLNNGELTVELDETNNAFRLRGKDSGGTVREATVAW